MNVQGTCLHPWSSVTNLRILGFSPWSPERLLQELLGQRALADLPGDFVLVATGTTHASRTEHLIATSVVAARPYFIIDRPGAPIHGESVFRLVAEAGLSWDWDLNALRSVAWLGHTVAEQTLHPSVRRVPANSLLVHDGTGSWSVESQGFWRTVFTGVPSMPDRAVDVFADVVDDVVDGNPLVSLSAGFDSRALLAAMLRAGKRPTVLTMGDDDSTDVIVAKQIATAEGLEHRIVRLNPEEYLPAARIITEITGGTKTVGHWHTYLYPRGQLGPGQQHLVGSNGEFARTFYLDRGLLASMAAIGRGASVSAYWGARIYRRSQRMAPWLPFLSLNGRTGAPRFSRFVANLAADGGGDGLERLDRFYSQQRVRHFIGNGIALYAQHGNPVSPFLDARWIRAVAGLQRIEKLGSNYHRRIIKRLYPGLLDHPIGGYSTPVRPRVGYRTERKVPTVSFSPAPALLRSVAVTNIIFDSPHLSALITRKQTQRAAMEGTVEVRDYLLTLHFAGEAAMTAPDG